MPTVAETHIQNTAPGPAGGDGQGDTGNVAEAHGAGECRRQRLPVAEFALLVGLVVAAEHDAHRVAQVPVGKSPGVEGEEQPAAEEQHNQRRTPDGVDEGEGEGFEGLHDAPGQKGAA
jgi:hypothetical protein